MDGWFDVGALDIIGVLDGSDDARALGRVVCGYCPMRVPIDICCKFRFARVDGLIAVLSTLLSTWETF